MNNGSLEQASSLFNPSLSFINNAYAKIPYKDNNTKADTTNKAES